MKSFKGLIAVSIFLIIISFACTKNPASIDNVNQFGSIVVDVHALQHKGMVIYGDGSKDIPKYPVIVDLKVRDETTNTLITIDSKLTDTQGYTVFDSLYFNTYYIYPKADSNIGYIWPDSTEICKNNFSDTIRVGVSYNWNFSKLNFEIAIDSAKLAFEYPQFNDRIYFLYNNGVRDTLLCKFDISKVPDWLHFEINKTIYIPMYPPTVDHWIHIYFWTHEIPINNIPMSFEVPVIHQFGADKLNFCISFK